ncbi:MAG: aldo/keto reductase [Oscillospiraceae bacterium]|jgi:aryl-alcohol dehydrogenase-like predicted oxidoreductase|nr:aldo/keto reductase [Oscillospiraceae bacterium]
MKTINVGGLSLTCVALGAGSMGKPDSDKERFAIMDAYVERGGNCFDTARVYANGESDKALGRWLKSSGMRGQVIICAKGCHPYLDDMFHYRLSRAEILGDLDMSLEAFGVSQTDLFLLHRDWPKLPVEPIVEALNEAVKTGRAKVVGVSNWTVGRIAEAIAYAEEHGLVKPSVCQLHTSLALTTAAQTQDITHVPMNETEAIWYRQTGFPIMGFGTQARGFFARHLAGLEHKKDTMQYYGRIPENYRRAERADILSKKLGVSLAAVLTAYVRDCGLNAVALVSVSSVKQLDEVWQSNDISLSQSQIRYLEYGDKYDDE